MKVEVFLRTQDGHEDRIQVATPHVRDDAINLVAVDQDILMRMIKVFFSPVAFEQRKETLITSLQETSSPEEMNDLILKEANYLELLNWSGKQYFQEMADHLDGSR